MRGYSISIVAGTIGNDLELKQTPTGKSVVSFSMATNKEWTDSSGIKQEFTNWHNIVAWGKAAEILCEHMKKGSTLLVQGETRTRDWETEDGTKRYRTELIVDQFTFLGGGKGSGEGMSEAPDVEQKKSTKKPVKNKAPLPQDEISIEDIPF